MKVMIAPGRYVQGAGAVREAGAHVALLGKKALVVGGKRGLESVRAKSMPESFAEHGIGYVEIPFGGECSRQEITRLTDLAKRNGTDVVVAAGGGKAIDTAKAAAYELKQPVAIVPTIAATDAPCSALSVVYTAYGVFESYLVLPRNPDLVLMDSEIIAEAPVRLLVSGMGDALATVFEARACLAKRAPNMPGGQQTASAMALAELCYDILMNNGTEAVAACRAHAVTPALDKVIEANTLLSGIGFESAGLAASHAVHNGLTVLEETHPYYHGEKVAWGVLTQLVLEDYPRETVRGIMDFCREVGLPTTLKELGLASTAEALRPAAEAACAPGETMHNMPFTVTPDMTLAAMLGADALGRERAC